MSCKLDVRKAILQDVKQVLNVSIPVEYRNTYSFINDHTIKIVGKVDNAKTKVQSVEKAKKQAFSIAKWIAQKVAETYNNSVHTYLEQDSPYDAMNLVLTPSDEYVEAEYQKLPENRKSDPEDQIRREFQRRMEDEQIDEFGDSVPMYQRLSDIDAEFLQRDPEGFYKYLVEQMQEEGGEERVETIYGYSNIVKARNLAFQKQLQLENQSLGQIAVEQVVNKIQENLGVSSEIIDEDTAKELLKDSSIPYNGEPAFFFKDKVYLVKGKFDLSSKLHEIIHPFVRAIAKYNTPLFNKLYQSAKDEKETFEYVSSLYPELVELAEKGDSLPFMEEFMVYLIQKSAVKEINNLPQGEQSMLQKFWNSLKYFLRELFGLNNSISELSENTSVEDLVKILVYQNSKIDLKGKDGLWNYINPMYNRDFVPEIEKLGAKLNTQIETFFAATKTHLERIRNSKNLAELKDILGDDNPLVDARNYLNFANKLMDDMNDDKKKLLSFAEAISGISVMSERMLGHVEEFITRPDVGERYKIGVLVNYGYIIKDWKQVLEEFNKQIGLKNSPLKNEVVATLDRFNSMDELTKDFVKEIGLVSVFKKEFETNAPLMAALDKLKKEIDLLKDDYNKGNKNASLSKKIEDLTKLYERSNPTEENISKWLSGEMGDTNWLSMMFESYTSSPNIIVGGFANMFFKEKAKIDAQLQRKNSAFFKKFDAIFKKFGIDRTKIEDTFDKITDVVKLFYIDKEGKQQSRDVRVFANQYSGDYQYLMDKYKNDLENLPNKSPEKLALRKEFEKFKEEYMFSDASDIVNKAKNFWLQSPLHDEARQIRERLLAEAELLQKSSATTPDELKAKNDQLKLIWRRYSRLASNTRMDGTPKIGEDSDLENDITMAQIFREYREKFGNLYERVEIKQAFESAKKLKEDLLIQSGLTRDSEEFKDQMSLWFADNLRIANSEKFYKDRQAILDEIQAITSKLNPDEQKKLDIASLWNKIFDISKGFRDEDGHPIGNDMTPLQQELIAKIEDEIEEIRSTFATKSGLSKEEMNEFYNLQKVNRKKGLTREEKVRYKELYDKKKKLSNNITDEESDRLSALFGKLRDFQTKIPTSYYVEEFNNWMELLGENKASAKVLKSNIPVGSIDHLFAQSPDFEKWFMTNHTIREVFDSESKIPSLVYERRYIWSRIIPNDEDIERAIQENDYAALLTSDNPYISATPSNEYYFYTLKKEYKTPRIEGVTVDNRGNFLPRPTQRTATPEQLKLMTERNIGFAKDERYESKVYIELLKNPALQGYKELVELYKEHSLDSQKDLDRYARLWYEVPRMRKTAVEVSKIDDAKQTWTNVKSWFERINPFVKKEIDDAFTENQGNWQMPELTKHYVMTDLFGNQPTSIPIKYTSYVEEDKMSKDLGQAVVMYGVSAETNKLAKDINPVAQVLRQTLLDNKIKDANSVAKNFLGLKFLSPNVIKKDAVASNMYQAVNNFIETFIEGKERIQYFGAGVDRAANTLMKVSAFGSMALSPVSAIKNVVSGNIQKTLEGITGTKYNAKTLAEGEALFDTKYIPALIKDYSTIGERSLETQIFETFDPMIDYTDKVGQRANRSIKSEIASGKFFFALQKGGEIHVQGSTFVIMLHSQKVPFTDAQGNTKEIPYSQAWTTQDGVLKLRDGVDKSWDIDGDNFAQFKLSVQKTNERLQGAYAKENSSNIQRYSGGNLLVFMRKYFAPMFVNRFGAKRLGVTAGDFREGYYVTTFNAMKDTLKEGKKNWHTYTEEEKRNMMKTAAEIGYSMLMMLIISLLGWDEDDEDKYKKLEEDWVRAYLIFQIMAIKSESETFIPLPSMGLDEWLRNITTVSVAFNTLKRYRKLSEDLALWVMRDEDAYYDKNYGVYEKGDVKFMADLYKITGLKNWLVLQDPKEGIKEYVMMSKRF